MNYRLILIALFVLPIAFSDSATLDALMQSESVLYDLQSYNLSTNRISDTLLLAQRSFIGENISYVESLLEGSIEPQTSYLNHLITIGRSTPLYEIEKQDMSRTNELVSSTYTMKATALKLFDTLPIVEKQLSSYESKGIPTDDARSLLDQSSDAFTHERYEEAETLLRDAQNELQAARIEHYKLSGLLKFSKTYIERNWKILTLGLVVLLLLAYPLFLVLRNIRAHYMQKKLSRKITVLNKLLKATQESYFTKHEISKAAYEQRVETYRNELSETKHHYTFYQKIAQIFPVSKKR